jgi:hypothetical protein
MSRLLFRASFALPLALGVFLVSQPASGRDDDDDDIALKKKTAEVGKEVSKFADDLPKLKADDAKAAAEELAKKHALDVVMYQFKPRGKDGIGLGVGPKGAITPDGIDLKLRALSTDALTPAQLAAQKPHLLRMADVTLAIAEMTPSFKAPKPTKPARASAWADFSADMKAGAVEFKKSLSAGTPAQVKVAATKLYASCSDCHGVFR